MSTHCERVLARPIWASTLAHLSSIRGALISPRWMKRSWKGSTSTVGESGPPDP